MTTEKTIQLAKECGGDIEYWTVNPPKLKAICFSQEALEKFKSAVAQEWEARVRYSNALGKEYFDKLNIWRDACITSERQQVQLLMTIRDAKRTARLMHTGEGHEVVCLEPHLWKDIVTTEGGVRQRVDQANGTPPEPFDHFKTGVIGWTNCAKSDERGQPLYNQAAVDQLGELRRQNAELRAELREAEQKYERLNAISEENFGKLNGWMQGCIAAEKERDSLLVTLKTLIPLQNLCEPAGRQSLEIIEDAIASAKCDST